MISSIIAPSNDIEPFIFSFSTLILFVLFIISFLEISLVMSFLSSFDGQIEWKGRATPVINFNKIYRIIFFPIFVLYWVYRKIR